MSDPSRTEPAVVEVAPAQFAQVAPRVATIEERARAADGHPSLGEAIWRDLEHPGTDSAGFLVDDRAYAHAARSDNVTPGNCAPRHWVLGTTTAPEARADGARAALARRALAHVGAHGGGLVVLWLLGAHDTDDTELERVGLRPARDLYEMRVPLPLTEEPVWAPGIDVRPFAVGHDEEAWLEVNNRAFADHEEQGGWVASTLARRMTEPWFDPSLFLLAFDAQGLAGFNWLKIHDAHGRDRSVGEIYVIGIDPRMQGSGLGRALALAGLRAVAARGVDTGMLFCAAGNAPALGLYESLGFTVHRTDRAYALEVVPA